MLPVWAACMLLVLGGTVGRDNTLESFAAMGYLLGSFALGAQVFGMEYLHRTLPMLLTQPIPRWRIYLIKLSVLAFALTTLAAASLLGVFQDEDPRHLPAAIPQILGAVWLTTLTLAPVLTMLSRNPIAGALFAGSLIGVVATTGGLIGLYRFGDHAAGLIDRFQAAFFWRVMPWFWIAGGVGSWFVFRRLEATEGRGAALDPFAWLQRLRGAPPATATRRHPVLCLVTKELQIQQLAFVLAALYALIAAILLWRQYMDPSVSIRLIAPVTFMYGAGLAIVIGSLASAEERHFGTLASQMLLPMPASRQWLVKAAVVISVSLLLAIGLPLATLSVLDDPGINFFATVRPVLTAIVVLTCASLYVSTLATSGVRALTFAVPFVFGGVLLIEWAQNVVWWVRPWRPGVVFRGAIGDDLFTLLTVAVAAGLAVMLLRLGYVNHRTTEISYARAARQVACVAAYVFVSAVLLEVAFRGW
jgi:hypothetical protein